MNRAPVRTGTPGAIPPAGRRAPGLRRAALLGSLAVLAAGPCAAPAAEAPRPATLVLEFELNDLTLYPNVDQELHRVAMLRPLLVEDLEVVHDRPVAAVPADAADESAKGVGYVFDRPEVAAKLAREAGATTVVSGRLHKASHLFVYLKAQLIDARDARVIADYVVEIKGWGDKLTAKGVDALAAKIDATLDAREARDAPAPASRTGEPGSDHSGASAPNASRAASAG